MADCYTTSFCEIDLPTLVERSPVLGKLELHQSPSPSEHDATVSTVAVVWDEGPVSIPKLSDWLKWLLDQYKDRLYRFKGVIMAETESGMSQRYVIQGVHELWNLTLVSTGSNDNTTRLAFIGRDVTEMNVATSFRSRVVNGEQS